MKNRDIYLKDLSRQKLVNEGVANVNDDMTTEAMFVLRYELETFICEGQYEKALVQVKSQLFPSPDVCTAALNNLYKNVSDISTDEMLKAMRQAISRNGKFPLTVVVLDEVQQYIGSDSQRSMDVQEAVEACCKNFGGKLLFIGTGQTAVTGTSNLKKLEGRFTVRVELSDADVDAVIRKVILAKKASAIAPIEETMQVNLGEISRHLAGTTLGHRQEDVRFFAQDYPILPVRLNIRPFMTVGDVKKKGAGVLRDKPNIKWNKDRGKDVQSAPWYHLFKGDRINDHHLTLAEKRAARRREDADAQA